MADLARLVLEAVVMAVTDHRPRVLTVGSSTRPRLPAGPPAEDATLEMAMTRLLDEQTGLSIGYVEQLYTFGDRVRGRSENREIGVAYLALAREAPTAAEWVDVYRLFPWEDRRGDDVAHVAAVDALTEWASDDDDRRTRLRIAFGLGDAPWDGVRALERYELLYEAHAVPEWHVDHPQPGGQPDGLRSVEGLSMEGDHRRVVSTALARIRGKITYRPVVFELVSATFTLGNLQRTVEALAGSLIHTQNFRRLVERGGLVEGTGSQTTTGGRPAELFRFRADVLTERDRPGVGRW